MRAVPRRHNSPALRPTVPWRHTGPPAGLGFANCRVPPEAISSTAQSPPVACGFQVEFRKLKEQRPGFAHHALLHVQIRKLLKRADFFRREFRNSLVNRDRFGQESVADEELRQPFEIFDGLKSLALADVQLADGHQRDLVARLVLQDLLILRDCLRYFALIQQLLRGFDVFALVISHAKRRQLPPSKAAGNFLLNSLQVLGPCNLLFSRYAPTLEASTKPRKGVNRQLSPWRIRYSQRTNSEGWITNGPARFRAEAPLAPLRPPSNPLRGRARTSGGGGAKGRAGEVPPDGLAWHNLYAEPSHIADRRCPIFPCRHRGGSWPG